MADTQANYKAIGDGTVKVTTPGTAVQFNGGTAQGCRQVHVTAFTENTGACVVVGSSSVVAASGSRRGRALAPGETVVMPVDNLNMLYVDALNAGDGVSFLYYRETA